MAALVISEVSVCPASIAEGLGRANGCRRGLCTRLIAAAVPPCAAWCAWSGGKRGSYLSDFGTPCAEGPLF
jgi:hypothetical protein